MCPKCIWAKSAGIKIQEDFWFGSGSHFFQMIFRNAISSSKGCRDLFQTIKHRASGLLEHYFITESRFTGPWHHFFKTGCKIPENLFCFMINHWKKKKKKQTWKYKLTIQNAFQNCNRLWGFINLISCPKNHQFFNIIYRMLQVTSLNMRRLKNCVYTGYWYFFIWHRFEDVFTSVIPPNSICE